MRSFLRWMVGLITGGIFLILGAFVAFRPLWSHAPPLTSARWLDCMLAFVLLLRGVINIRTSLARRRAMATQG